MIKYNLKIAWRNLQGFLLRIVRPWTFLSENSLSNFQNGILSARSHFFIGTELVSVLGIVSLNPLQTMLRHNLLLIYRTFKRYKSTFLINLTGLSTGLACALLIYRWVNDELNVDKFHEKDKQLYQVMESQQHAGNIRVTNSTPGLLAEALANEMPEVEFAATVTPSFWFEKSILSFEAKDIKASGPYAGKDFFNIFSFELLQGDKDQVLADKNSIVISEELALRIFNTTENILGKAVEFQHKKEFIVSGIFDNAYSSSYNSDFILSYEEFKDMNEGVLEWGSSGPSTFLTSKVGTDPGNLRIRSKILSKASIRIHTGPYCLPGFQAITYMAILKMGYSLEGEYFYSGHCLYQFHEPLHCQSIQKAKGNRY
jgi:hypothetical protein